MRSALKSADGDIIAFVDADVTNFGPHFITGLLGPVLLDGSVTLVKGFYQRPLHGAPDGGGRVTELTAKPIIDLLFPHLASIERNERPISRLIEYTVFCGSMTLRCLAAAPTTTPPLG